MASFDDIIISDTGIFEIHFIFINGKQKYVVSEQEVMQYYRDRGWNAESYFSNTKGTPDMRIYDGKTTRLAEIKVAEYSLSVYQLLYACEYQKITNQKVILVLVNYDDMEKFLMRIRCIITHNGFPPYNEPVRPYHQIK